MDVNTIRPANSTQSYSAPKRSDAAKELQPVATSADIDPMIHNQQVKDLSSAEKERLDTVMEGAKRYAASVGSNPMTFTIFKDVSGQYITRFKNKDTGAVTYVPEPDIVKYMEVAADRRSNLLEVSA